MSSWLSRYPRALPILVGSTVLMVSGFSVLWPLVTLYVHTKLGLSMTTAGLVLLIQSSANLVGNLIGGRLFDLWGGRRTIILGAGAAALGAPAMALWQGFLPYLTLTIVVGVGTGLIYPSIYAYAATIWPQGRRAAFNAVYVASNIGVAIGSFAGGMLAQIGFALSFEVTGAVFALYFLLALVWFRGPAFAPTAVQRARSDSPAAAPLSLGAAPLLLALGLLLDWMAYVQWQTTVAVHMQVLGFSLSSYSVLWTLNGALIVLGQPLVTWYTRRSPRIKSHLLLGNVLFIAAFLILVRSTAYSGFLLAMGLATLGEMFVWPGVPAAADQLAPDGRRGMYQGVMSGAASLGRMLGPLLGGLLYDHYPTEVLFLVMTCLFVAGFAVLSVYDRAGVRRSLRRPASTLDS